MRAGVVGGLGRGAGGEFDHERAARREERSGVLDERAHEGEPVGAGAEGEVGLVVLDIGLDGVPLVVGDVGGLARIQS